MNEYILFKAQNKPRRQVSWNKLADVYIKITFVCLIAAQMQKVVAIQGTRKIEVYRIPFFWSAMITSVPAGVRLVGLHLLELQAPHSLNFEPCSVWTFHSPVSATE